MTKRKSRRHAEKLYNTLHQISAGETPSRGRLIPKPKPTATPDLPDAAQPAHLAGHHDAPIDEASCEFVAQLPADKQELTRMKKFRFQLLHRWLVENYAPCRAADVGGGKGLLSYLLQQSGWQATVIDPVYQDLPHKYKDIIAGKRVKIPPTASVPHITAEFESIMAKEFDLLLGMHAHGCNMKIIDGAKEYGGNFVLLPCCVIDEPVYPRLGVHWLECVADYAVRQGFEVRPFRIPFKGQNIGLYSVPK